MTNQPIIDAIKTLGLRHTERNGLIGVERDSMYEKFPQQQDEDATHNAALRAIEGAAALQPGSLHWGGKTDDHVFIDF